MSDQSNDPLKKAPVGSKWRHIKHANAGPYEIVAHGLIEADLTQVIIYRQEHAELVWVRPASEFMDGRFIRLKQ